MPLTDKGNKILEAMRKTYGPNAERVFYASKNAGTITGVDKLDAALQKVAALDAKLDRYG